MTDLYSSLFGDGGLKVNANQTEQNQGNQNEFRPHYRKGQNNRYEALIRFLPNPENPSEKSITSKYTVFLKNPLTNQGRTVDSPSTVGEPDPLSNMYFTLKNSGNPQAIQVADDFKRHQNFYSLVQIIQSASEPALNGKILIWKYGQKIYEKIRQEMEPVMQGQAGRQPFDLFNGRLFKVIAVQASGFNNFDQSLFVDVQYPANCMLVEVPNPQIPNSTQFVQASREMASTDEGRKIIFEYLSTKAPKMSDYDYRPWDTQTKQYVDEIINIHANILNGVPMQAPQAAAAVSAMSVNQQAPMQAQPQPITPSLTNDILGGQPAAPVNPTFGGMPSGVSQAIQQPVNPVNPVAPTQPAPAAPIPGLNVGGDAASLGVQPAPAQIGNVTGIDMGSINSILNNSPVQTAPGGGTQVPGIGDVASIIGDTFM